MKAAFLDRDGVINEDRGYVHRIADFVFLPGVVDALRRLAKAGYALVVVTNQSGIARGLFDAAAYAALTAHMERALANAGVTLTGVYHCPHLPGGDCGCRKPGAGLILAAVRDHGLDLAASLLVGDKSSDIAAGRAAGVGRCFRVGGAREPGAGEDAWYPGLAACVAALTVDPATSGEL